MGQPVPPCPPLLALSSRTYKKSDLLAAGGKAAGWTWALPGCSDGCNGWMLVTVMSPGALVNRGRQGWSASCADASPCEMPIKGLQKAPTMAWIAVWGREACVRCLGVMPPERPAPGPQGDPPRPPPHARRDTVPFVPAVKCGERASERRQSHCRGFVSLCVTRSPGWRQGRAC